MRVTRLVGLAVLCNFVAVVLHVALQSARSGVSQTRRSSNEHSAGDSDRGDVGRARALRDPRDAAGQDEVIITQRVERMKRHIEAETSFMYLAMSAAWCAYRQGDDSTHHSQVSEVMAKCRSLQVSSGIPRAVLEAHVTQVDASHSFFPEHLTRFCRAVIPNTGTLALKLD